MTIRNKRLLIRLVCHGGVVMVLSLGMVFCELANNFPSAGIFFLFLLIYIATIRINPLPRFIEREIIKQAECPACGEILDLVNTWSCGCGFVSWEPHHVLTPCPNCHKTYSWLVCPRCEASILI